MHLALADALEDRDERALHLGRGTEVPSEAVASELEEAADRLDARGAPETAAALAETGRRAHAWSRHRGDRRAD